MMKRLIVNADDLGADEARNRGIFEAIDAEVLTSVSLLVNGPGVEEPQKNRNLDSRRISPDCFQPVRGRACCSRIEVVDRIRRTLSRKASGAAPPDTAEGTRTRGRDTARTGVPYHVFAGQRNTAESPRRTSTRPHPSGSNAAGAGSCAGARASPGSESRRKCGSFRYEPVRRRLPKKRVSSRTCRGGKGCCGVRGSFNDTLRLYFKGRLPLFAGANS